MGTCKVRHYFIRISNRLRQRHALYNKYIYCEGRQAQTRFRVKGAQPRLWEAATYERVNRLEASLHRLVHGFSGDNAGGLLFDSGTIISHNGTLAIDGVTEGVDDSADDAVANGDINDRASALHDIAFLDLSARVTKLRVRFELQVFC